MTLQLPPSAVAATATGALQPARGSKAVTIHLLGIHRPKTRPPDPTKPWSGPQMTGGSRGGGLTPNPTRCPGPASFQCLIR